MSVQSAPLDGAEHNPPQWGPSTKAESPAKLKRELSEAMICARVTCAFHDFGCEIKFLPCGASISIRREAHDAHFGARTAGPMV